MSVNSEKTVKLEKPDFEIFMVLHRGENENYSEKKLFQKFNSASRYCVPKVKVAKS